MSGTVDIWRPHPREWINVDTPADGHRSFTIMTYNILCDCAALSNPGYGYLKDGNLKMEDRHPRIMEEVGQLRPDVLCLQEVENSNLNERLIPDLETQGYRCASGETGFREGPSTFYRSDRFSLDCYERIVAHDAFMDLVRVSH
jgi:mRNA deadenylase 3'-5' endonuclease subunit Ccr4